MTSSRRHHERRMRPGLLAGSLLFAAASAVSVGAHTNGALAADGESFCSVATTDVPAVDLADEAIDPAADATTCRLLDAPVEPAIAELPRYDLALIIRLARNQVFFVGNTVTFEIVVANHGDLPSGPFSVQQVIAPGMALVNADQGGFLTAGTVQWTDLAELRPGEQRTLTVGLRLDSLDIVNGHRTVAEISRDSGDDWNSTPDNNPYNDGLIDTDDISLAIVGDSDDHDIAEITAAQVRFDNQLRLPTAQIVAAEPAPEPALMAAEPEPAPAHATPQEVSAATPLGANSLPTERPAPIVSGQAATVVPNVIGQPAEATLASAQPRLLPATGSDTDATLLMAVALTSAGLLLIGFRRSQMLSRPRDDG
jgi:uncharacterized repeat protein (TIGR01451 family)/LPXTG-motif cell wall-anchored protein